MPEIVAENLSEAWLEAGRLAESASGNEISNLIVHLVGLESGLTPEFPELRSRLDTALEGSGYQSIRTVANTIFPASLWDRGMRRQVLYERYLRLWPRISAKRQNRRGTYFQRLIDYPRNRDVSFNQLEHVIGAYGAGIRRRSTLQCAILVPYLDLNATPYQGFPCLQQVAFLPERHGKLRIAALYPMHYLWERAYGNYVGLIELGRFMAHEMGLELSALTCVSLIAKLDNPRIAVPILRRS